MVNREDAKSKILHCLRQSGCTTESLWGFTERSTLGRPENFGTMTGMPSTVRVRQATPCRSWLASGTWKGGDGRLSDVLFPEEAAAVA